MLTIGVLTFSSGTVLLNTAGSEQRVMCSPYIYLTANVVGNTSSLASHAFVWEQIFPSDQVVDWVPATGLTTSPPPTQTTIRLPTPGIPTGTPVTGGGTLIAGNNYARIVAIDSYGNTTNVGIESAAVVSLSGGSIGWSWTAVTGAISYQIWVGTTSGIENSYFTSTTNSFTQTSPVGLIGTMPNTNGTVLSTEFMSTITLASMQNLTVKWATFRFWIDKGQPSQQFGDVRVYAIPVDAVNNGAAIASHSAGGFNVSQPFNNVGLNAGLVQYRGLDSMSVVNYLNTLSPPPANSSIYVALPGIKISLPAAGTANLTDIVVRQNTTGTYTDIVVFTPATTNTWNAPLLAYNLLGNATYQLVAEYNTYGVKTSQITSIGYPGNPGTAIARIDTINNTIGVQAYGNPSAFGHNTVLLTRLVLTVPTDTQNTLINSTTQLTATVNTTTAVTMATLAAGGSILTSRAGISTSSGWSSTTTTLSHQVI